jgi:ribosomal protein L37E
MKHRDLTIKKSLLLVKNYNKVKNMKCPECTGDMEYNNRIRKHVCLACGAAYRSDEIEDYWEDERYKEDPEEQNAKGIKNTKIGILKRNNKSESNDINAPYSN